jgi:DNA-binding transcriptional LysR family regulator
MDASLLPLYHIFNSVARQGSISGAAKELFISQPAVSKSIQKLETALNTTLFYRNSRGVSLTPEGTILAEHIENAFETLLSGEEQLKHINDLGIGHIRIGVSSTLCKHMLLPYLKDFLFLHPHTQITIVCQSTLHTLRLLENHEIDIGLIARPTSGHKLNLITTGNLEDTFAATPEYIDHLMEREHIGSDQLLDKCSLILLDKDNATRKYMDSYFGRWGIDTDNAMEVGSMELLIDFMKTGLGAGCVIKQFITNELASGQLIEIIPPTPVKPRTACFAYSKSAPLSDAVHLFIDYIQTKQLKQAHS